MLNLTLSTDFEAYVWRQHKLGSIPWPHVQCWVKQRLVLWADGTTEVGWVLHCAPFPQFQTFSLCLGGWPWHPAKAMWCTISESTWGSNPVIQNVAFSSFKKVIESFHPSALYGYIGKGPVTTISFSRILKKFISKVPWTKPKLCKMNKTPVA